MGTVWRAEDELLGRHVALKKLHVPPHLADDERETLYERTRREARSAARITHQNVVVVHDVVNDGGLPCIVMEHVPSRTLGDLLKQDGPVTPDEAARIGRGMIAALRAAHAAGVLHRDVKPGNVLLGEDGRVVLTDFGIAVASGTSTLTRTGELVGSVDYVAPERVRGGTPGPASDLWALGATLYQALEGRPPFRKDTAIETAYSIAVDPLEPPLRAGSLTPLIEHLLSKDPEARPSAETVELRLRDHAAEAETAYVDRGQFPDQDATTTMGRLGGPGTAAGRSDDTGQGFGTNSHGTGGYVTGTGGPGTGGYGPATGGPGTGQGAVGAHGRAGVFGPAEGTQGAAPYGGYSGDTPSVPTPMPAPSPAPRRRKSRVVLWTAVAVVLAGAVGGYVLWPKTGFGPDASADQGPSAPTDESQSKSESPSKPTPKPSPLPDGYRLVKHEKEGVSVPVPDGWDETDVDDSPIAYVDPSRTVSLRINVLDFATTKPLQHWKDDEAKSLADGNFLDYKQLRMQSTTFRDMPAAIWEFNFTGKRTLRRFRALDLGFGEPGGKEYAVYLSAPDENWEENKKIFDDVRNSLKIHE
ncbi:serine/threonine-protein kinase [Streptomyces sp. NPDC051776]|uniref:serine/threonine-protein kinase n=1 Tax=Streptomyces sp. NPDC051776 TaxID=3155414 RepID=UPI0034392D94